MARTHDPFTSLAGHRPRSLQPLRRGVRAVPASVLPMLAILAGSLLPERWNGAIAAAPGILFCSVLLGVVSLPALDATATARRNVPAAVGRLLVLAVLGPLLTGSACALASLAGFTTGCEGRWAILTAASPISIGTVVAARTLGLGQRRMAGFVLLSTVSTPVVLPNLAYALGLTENLGVGALAVLVASSSGLPMLAGLALRGIRPLGRPGVRLAASRGALGALTLLGLLRGIGLAGVVQHDPGAAARSAGLAVLVALCGVVALWPLTRRWPDAVLAGAFRSNTLVWAALGSAVTGHAALLLSLTTLVGYAAPAVARLALGRRGPVPRSSAR